MLSMSSTELIKTSFEICKPCFFLEKKLSELAKSMANSSVITLNIGGELFASKRDTLLQMIGNQEHLLRKLLLLHENPKSTVQPLSTTIETSQNNTNLHHEEESDRIKHLNHNNTEVDRPIEVELLYDKDGNIFIGLIFVFLATHCHSF